LQISKQDTVLQVSE